MGAIKHTDDGEPWGGHFGETHILGNWWFINRYSAAWWTGAILATVALPPVGAFCLGYMLIACIYAEGDDVDAELS